MRAAGQTTRRSLQPAGHSERTDPLAKASHHPDDWGGPGLHLHAPHDHPCTDEQIRTALIRALQSQEFQSAPQLRAFLEFVVSAALSHHREKIKGYTIAVEALGRPEDFNPVTDPIVRVEAARLRRRLDKYYSGTGADDPVRIEIPKGSYAPKFHRAVHTTARDTGRTEDLTEASGTAASPDAGPETEASLDRTTAAPGLEAEAVTASATADLRLLPGKWFELWRKAADRRISLPLAALAAAACFLAGYIAGAL